MTSPAGAIAPGSRPILLRHDHTPDVCFVLFHGLTNAPPQYGPLAAQLHAAGANVYVPLLPHHGLADVMTPLQARLTAAALGHAANEAVDTAHGLGRRVVVAGLSMGGVIAGWIAQHRADVSAAIPFSPVFSIVRLPLRLVPIAAPLLSRGPNLFLWWDPVNRAKYVPPHAYPRLSTRALGQVLRLSADVYAAARRTPPATRRITVVINDRDPALNNAAPAQIAQLWAARGADVTVHHFGRDLPRLPRLHEIVDPGLTAFDDVRRELVFPHLVPIILRTAGIDPPEPVPAPRPVSTAS
ncbi:MAG TPA: alpha/beta hydrolase [Chloroflexota bacterium]|nr:alpha/beta hydrolase [Chloroflexota bacterium]